MTGLEDRRRSQTCGRDVAHPERSWFDRGEAPDERPGSNIADTESLQVRGTSVDDWSIEENRIQGTIEVACAEEIPVDRDPISITYDYRML